MHSPMPDRVFRTLVTILFVQLLVIFSQVLPSALAEGGDYKLTILHTNDVHAHYLPVTPRGGTCYENTVPGDECTGDVARLATRVKEIRTKGHNVLLLDAGDQFTGSLFHTRYRGEASRRFMNVLDYDAMELGNHEFDEGPCTLGNFIRGLQFPALGANIDASREPCLAGLIKPYTLLDAGGEKIAVVGVITDDLPTISNPGSNVHLGNTDSILTSILDELKSKGVDKIILLSHAGLLQDQEMAATLEGIDVIVGGHTHALLSNSRRDSAGPYPLVVRSPGDTPVLVVTAGSNGRYLGHLDVTFNQAGEPISWSGEPVLIDSGIPRDPETLAVLEELNRPLQALREQIVGTAAADFSGDASLCRFEECSLGNLVADALLWATAEQGTRIALQNGGGIRASIPHGKISMGQIMEALPFANAISTFELQGKDLAAVLEHSVSRAENPRNSGTGRFLQVAGLRFQWNPSRPEGARVVRVEVRNPDGTFAPLDMDGRYKVVTNSFLRRGGDGYQVLATRAMNACDYGPQQLDAAASYITSHSPVAPGVEGRIQRIGAAPDGNGNRK